MRTDRWAALLLLLMVGATVAQAHAVGFRNDGNGVWAGSSAPETWSKTDHVVWRTPMPTWSNASPVVAGGRVCASAEPTTLLCVDAATGRLLWQAEHPVTDTLPAEQRAAAEAKVAAAERAEAEATQMRAEVSRLSREVRATPSPEATARLSAAQAKLDALRTVVADAASFRTPANQGFIGWTAPSPVSDGKSVWALFANGVVTSHSLDGTLRWSRWLGAPVVPMLGYDTGTSASPVLVGDTLIVGFGKLTGLDANTGAVRWTGESWPHYGAPGVGQVGGVPVLVGPRGNILRPRDGKVLGRVAAELWYVSPVIVGDTLLMLEARSGMAVTQAGGTTLKAWKLALGPDDTVVATPAWTRHVQAMQPFYGTPTSVLGIVYLVTAQAEVWTLSLATGEVLGTRDIDELHGQTVYTGASVAGGRLYVGNESGKLAVLTLGARPELVRVNQVETMRSAPAFVGGRLYLRSSDALYAIQ